MNTTSCFGTLSPQKFHRLSCVDVDEVTNPSVELCRITEPSDEIANLSVDTASRFQYLPIAKCPSESCVDGWLAQLIGQSVEGHRARDLGSAVSSPQRGVGWSRSRNRI